MLDKPRWQRSGDEDRIRGAAFGLAAAALFGASAPLSKLLLPGTGPLVLAGLLYLGAGLGLTLFRIASRNVRNPEARLRPADAPLLAGIVLTGGVLGPILMLVGLQRLPAVTSSLLLNLEAPFTMVLAIVLFGEHLNRREFLGAALTMSGAALLSYRPAELRPDWAGIGAIAAACLFWAIDNNLTQRLSLRDPVSVVRFKSLASGTVSLGLALALVSRQSLAAPPQIAAALLLGSLSYGLSIVLHLRALRLLGAARQAAFFSTAPFLGALLALPILGERPGRMEAAGAAVMMAGIVGLARARHSHVHTHEVLEHDHLHVHDEHHRHEHEGPVQEPHSHPHRHEALTHEHPHTSDAHHRHTHVSEDQHRDPEDSSRG